MPLFASLGSTTSRLPSSRYLQDVDSTRQAGLVGRAAGQSGMRARSNRVGICVLEDALSALLLGQSPGVLLYELTLPQCNNEHRRTHSHQTRE